MAPNDFQAWQEVIGGLRELREELRAMRQEAREMFAGKEATDLQFMVVKADLQELRDQRNKDKQNGISNRQFWIGLAFSVGTGLCSGIAGGLLLH